MSPLIGLYQYRDLVGSVKMVVLTLRIVHIKFPFFICASLSCDWLNLTNNLHSVQKCALFQSKSKAQ